MHQQLQKELHHQTKLTAKNSMNNETTPIGETALEAHLLRIVETLVLQIHISNLYIAVI